VFIVGLVVRGAAGRERALGVEYCRQVFQVHAGIVPGGLVLVIAVLIEVLEGEDDDPVAVLVLPGAVLAG
jgi:hypothetical protein